MVNLVARNLRLLLALAALAVATPIAAHAQTPGEGPEITYQNVHSGDVLTEHPHVFQFCFSEPVNIEGPEVSYNFGLVTPEGIGFSQRTVFQPDGYGVSIYPGSDVPEIPDSIPTAAEQEWSFHYLVTAADDNAPTEGEIKFTLSELATTVPHESTFPCLQNGFTIPPTGPVASTPAAAGSDDEDGDIDALLIGLIAVGVLAGLVVSGAVLLLVRRRTRKTPPPPG